MRAFELGVPTQTYVVFASVVLDLPLQQRLGRIGNLGFISPFPLKMVGAVVAFAVSSCQVKNLAHCPDGLRHCGPSPDMALNLRSLDHIQAVLRCQKHSILAKQLWMPAPPVRQRLLTLAQDAPHRFEERYFGSLPLRGVRADR